ncbi:Uncharacterised protein g1933 [Pycnogonum litorale]
MAAVKIVLLFVIVCIVSYQVEALSCLPCSQIKCTPKEELDCQAGYVTALCGCGCLRCAELAGSPCGGPWTIAGICADGLKCLCGEEECKRGLKPGTCKVVN